METQVNQQYSLEEPEIILVTSQSKGKFEPCNPNCAPFDPCSPEERPDEFLKNAESVTSPYVTRQNETYL